MRSWRKKKNKLPRRLKKKPRALQTNIKNLMRPQVSPNKLKSKPHSFDQKIQIIQPYIFILQKLYFYIEF